MAHDLSKLHYVRRFGLAAACFLFIAAFLGYSLLHLLHENQLRSTVRTILTKELANFTTSGLSQLLVNSDRGTLYVLAQVYSSNRFDPNQVRTMEQNLSKQLERPTQLIIREIRSTDVSANGSNSIFIANKLDGFFVSHESTPEVQAIRQSTQAIREFLSNHPRANLIDVDLLHQKSGPVIVAMVAGYQQLSPSDVQLLENRIRQATRNPEIRLMLRYVPVTILTSSGPIRYGWSTLHALTEKEKSTKERIQAQIESAFSQNENYMLSNINAVFKEDASIFLVGIEGTGAYTRGEVQALEHQLQKQSDKPVTLYIWLNHGPVMTADGLRSYNSLSAAQIHDFQKKRQEWLNQILQISNN